MKVQYNGQKTCAAVLMNEVWSLILARYKVLLQCDNPKVVTSINKGIANLPHDALAALFLVFHSMILP